MYQSPLNSNSVFVADAGFLQATLFSALFRLRISVKTLLKSLKIFLKICCNSELGST